MGRRGDAFDNAVAESFFAKLETELLDLHMFRSRDHARLAIFEWIEGSTTAGAATRPSASAALTASRKS